MLTWHVLELWGIKVMSALIRLFHMPLQNNPLHPNISMYILHTVIIHF